MNTPFKMYGKSPMMKALVGKQGNLPQELKAKILASPAKKYKSDAQRKAVHASKSESPAKMYGKKSPAKKPTDRKEKIAKNIEFNKVARETGVIPNFKTTKEKENFYSNKANVNMLNKKQKEYFKNKK